MALTMALRVKRGGFAMLATVCSSWVFMCRSVTERSVWHPLGNQKIKFVELGNATSQDGNGSMPYQYKTCVRPIV